MIFHDVRKWNGQSTELLSLSSFKQIAGRAGRFVLNGQNLPGIVTTLGSNGLLVLRRALELPIEPIRYARYGINFAELAKVLRVLPAGTPLHKVLELFRFVSKLHPSYELEDMEKKITFFKTIDGVVPNITAEDRLRFAFAPIKWNNLEQVALATVMFQMFERDTFVDYRRIMEEGSKVGPELEDLRALLDGKVEGGAFAAVGMVPSALLEHLESLHGALSAYVWLSYRQPVVYPHREQVTQLLVELRRGMGWCLNNLPKFPKARISAHSLSTPGKAYKKKTVGVKSDGGFERPRGNERTWSGESSWGGYGAPMEDSAAFGIKRVASGSY